MIAVLATLALAAPATAAHHQPAKDGCRTRACHRRVHKRQTRNKWRRAVDAYGPGLLAARAQCEGSGDYKMRFEGGHWFVLQFEARSWAAAGGRMRNGEPVGRWSFMPGRLEINYRAVRWDGIHGGDAWPNCP